MAANTELPLSLSVAQDSAGAPELPAGGLEPVGAIQRFAPMGLTAPGLEISVPFDPQLLDAGAQPLLLVAQPSGEWQAVAASQVVSQGKTSLLVATVPQLGYAVVVQAAAGTSGGPSGDASKAKTAGTSPSLSPSQPRVSLNLQSSAPVLTPRSPSLPVYSVDQSTRLVQSVSVSFPAACAPKVEVYGVLTRLVNRQLSNQVMSLGSRVYPTGSTSGAFTVTHTLNAAVNGSFTTFAAATCSQTVPGSFVNQLLSRLPAVALGQYFTVNVQASALPLISQNPQNTSTQAGRSVTFQVSASGPAPLAYQWQRSNNGGADWTNVGSNSASLTLLTTLADNASLWRVIVSNASGQITSAQAQLSSA